MGNNIDIDLFTQKNEITTSTPDITIEITGLVQLNSFIGLDDTPTYYENGKFFKVEDNKIVYTDINWSDVKGKIKDNPELVKEIGDFIQEKTEQYTSKTITKAIKAHDADANAHQSIQLTIQDNYTTLDNKIELNKIDSDTKIDQVNKRIDDNTEYITRVDNYSKEVNKKLEDLTLDVDVDIKGDINQLREDLTTTNQVVQDNYKEINGHITDLYNKKVDKVEGKELSTNDFTNELKTKLENIETTAQVNIIESISVDGVPQTIDSNKNVDLHQPVYTLVEKDTPADTNIKEYNLTIDGTTTGVTIEIPKDVYIEKCTLKYATVVDTPYTGAKVNDAYLQFDRANSTPIYTPITELQIHAGQDITVDENNTISTVIPIPRKISELNNDNYTVTDENYVHTDNNFTDGYIGRIEGLEATTVKNVEYSKETQKITITFGDKTTKILTLEELLTGASYDGETGNFTFTRANGEPVVVNTPKENFLSDVQYDGVTKVITFTMSSGATFEVNVSDLIDIYTVKSTNSVDMSITKGGQISSNVKVSATDGNIISVKTDGMYAKHQDISHLATKSEVQTGLSNKVDKEYGKVLIPQTELNRLANVDNYDDTQVKADIANLEATKQNNLVAGGDNVILTPREDGSVTLTVLGTISTDEVTITQDETGTITAIGVQTKSEGNLYSWVGTQAEYETDLDNGTITSDTQCLITDDEIELVEYIPRATNSSLGLVQPDGMSITIDEQGVISSVGSVTPIATVNISGKVKPDGTTITITSDGTISAKQQDLTPYLTKNDAAITYETVENVMSMQEELQNSINTKQDTTDDALTTTDKTIVGAINELNSSIGNISTVLDSIIAGE